jgi:cellulose synthase/poly-beta-1,6-N-acetylglucosamine synthase-like glycosyltransferase
VDDTAGGSVVVILNTRDRPALLEQTLAVLPRALQPGDELVVVDSASVDPAVGRIAEAAGARVVRCERPGTSRAKNAGLAATTAPIVAFTDDDCVPAPGWTANIAAALGDPEVGFVAGRVAGEDGPVALSVTVEQHRRWFRGTTDPMEVGHGANMGFRRVALEAIGGFDTSLGGGARFRAAEDHDVFWRVLRAGWTGVYEPAALVTHRQWRTRAQAVRLEYAYGLGAGAFASKATRVDLSAGLPLLARRLGVDGVGQVWRNARRGYRMPTVGSAMRVAGVVSGAVRSLAEPVDAGRFRDRATSGG